MRRVSKQCLIIICLCLGLLFFVFVLHNRISPLIQEESAIRITRPNYDDLNHRMAVIEHEMESQVHDSNILVNKISTALASNSTLQTELIRKIQGENKKLVELHNVLEQEGEVESVGDQVMGQDKGGRKSIVQGIPGDEEDENRANEILEDQSKEGVIAVLVLVCNRPTVTRCLEKLLQYRPSESKFPIILSQDCGKHTQTIQALQPFESKLRHIFQPDLSSIHVRPGHSQFAGYYKIARHYGWALNYTFNKLNYSNVIIVEDDIEVAPDFFEYFSATLPVLKKDPSLWCVSAWNDNGKENRINLQKHELLYRTDFFPGLGWMLTKDLWKEIGPKWPNAFWDDWMREPEQRKGRSCIRPEISRTSTFGKIGVSRGAYYQSHLKFIKLSDKFVPFSTMDLSYLTKEKYNKEFMALVDSATLLGSVHELEEDQEDAMKDGAGVKKREYKLLYNDNAQFLKLAKQLKIMDDFKAGVPRTAYHGIVSTMLSDHRIYLVPGPNWPGYKTS